MYATCIHCHEALGSNEMLERFPVGRRLAFDAAKGRLWVVCRACRQWNLTPLEERWEAIEAAERLFRDSPRRVATEQVGLARLRDGTELVRIGRPHRPELAAWRYGPRFAARHRRHIALGVASISVAAGYLIAGPVMGLAVGGGWGLPVNALSLATIIESARRVVYRREDPAGPLVATRLHVATARVLPMPEHPMGWGLSVPFLRAEAKVGSLGGTYDRDHPHRLLTGDEALAAARAALPSTNRLGGGRRAVEDAVRVLETTGGPNETFRRVARDSEKLGLKERASWLARLPVELRLALEMAAHEDQERAVAAGELTELEAAWRAAEEIAAIADGLALPARVLTSLERLGRRI